MKAAVKKARRLPRRFPATEKCRAVLPVWTGERGASRLARKLGLTGTALSHWQEQAMTGMLGAPGPRRRTEARPSPSNLRLQQLLDHTSSPPARQAPRLPEGRQGASAQPRGNQAWEHQPPAP